jgi:formate dehydrogenase subunit gamma
MTTHYRRYPEIRIRWIERYTTTERWLHWGHTVTFFVLVATGLPLFSGFMFPMAQGESGQFLRLLHRVAAVFFMMVPLIYIMVHPRRFVESLRNIGFGIDDLRWFKAAVPYYLFGRHGDMPPQGRWNTGEKINVFVSGAGTFVFSITGLVMWFGKGVVPVEFFQANVIAHNVAMIVSVLMFIVHFYIATMHPLMWGALVSMRFGVASEEFVRQHHAKWYKEHFEDVDER